MVSLWPASFPDVSFLFQIAEEVCVPSLSALGVRELPERDGRHGEDRHESFRIFDGFAYVRSDQADAAVIVGSLATREQGTLAVPELGPVQIRCNKFERCAQGDKVGYVCFAVRFVRDMAVAAIGKALPPRLVFDAADGVAAALVSLFPTSLSLGNGDDSVIGAAVYMVETVAASIEFVRTTSLIDPHISVQVEAVSAAITTAAPLLNVSGGVPPTDVANLLAAAPPLGVTFSNPAATLGAVIVSTIRKLCAGMAGNADGGTGALLELALDYPAVTNAEPVSANSAAAAANSASIIDLVRLAALAAWCEGLARRSYTGRSDAVAARADAAERLGHELNHVAGAGNFALYAAIQDLQDAIVRYLTRLVDLAPNVHREAEIPVPADHSVPIPFVPLILDYPTPERQDVAHFRGGAGTLSEDVTALRGKWQSAAADATVAQLRKGLFWHG
jgi:hypothetical protein